MNLNIDVREENPESNQGPPSHCAYVHGWEDCVKKCIPILRLAFEAGQTCVAIQDDGWRAWKEFCLNELGKEYPYEEK